MRALLRLLGLVPLAACGGLLRDPVGIPGMETQYGVHSLLVAGADSASVLVVRYPPAPAPSEPDWEEVTDATIRLVAGADTLDLALGAPGCTRTFNGTPMARCYRAGVPGGIVAGRTYGLLVDIPGFGRITGTTRIPTPPVIVSPSEGTRIEATFTNNQWPTMPIRLDVAADARRVEVALLEQDPQRECQVHFLSARGILILDADEAAQLSPSRFTAICYTQSGPQPLGELPVVLRAVSYDAEYARYAEIAFDAASGSILKTHARAGIDRGVGYFAGAAAAVVNVVMTGGGT